MENVWYFQIFVFFWSFHDNICLKKVFLNTDFYVVYNIYIMQWSDLFSVLQLNLLLNGKTFILQYLFN
jgi:hypothetical protein